MHVQQDRRGRLGGETLQQATSEKKAAFKSWQRLMSLQDRETYGEAKREVAQERIEVLGAWCENLKSALDKKNMYAMAKMLKRDQEGIMEDIAKKKQLKI